MHDIEVEAACYDLLQLAKRVVPFFQKYEEIEGPYPDNRVNKIVIKRLGGLWLRVIGCEEYEITWEKDGTMYFGVRIRHGWQSALECNVTYGRQDSIGLVKPLRDTLDTMLSYTFPAKG